MSIKKIRHSKKMESFLKFRNFATRTKYKASMFKTLLLLTIILISITNSMAQFSDKEIELINNGSADDPMRVLLITNKEDSVILRQKCEDINNIPDNKDLDLLIERLTTTLDVESGVGIAAPQVGISKNLFLFVRIDQPDMPVAVAINPKIINHPDEIICFEDDGCLSIPGRSGDSERYPWVEVEYTNEKGELIRETLHGHSRKGDFTAIIFQHEYDHLQGILYIDKLCKEKVDSTED